MSFVCRFREVSSVHPVPLPISIPTPDVWCGGGTYIRSLVRDVALSAATVAVVDRLVRLQQGRFLLSQALPVCNGYNWSCGGAGMKNHVGICFEWDTGKRFVVNGMLLTFAFVVGATVEPRAFVRGADNAGRRRAIRRDRLPYYDHCTIIARHTRSDVNALEVFKSRYKSLNL